MDKNMKEDLLIIIYNNKGKILGGLIGFLFGIIFLVVGFFKTLLILICTIIGYFLGSRWDIEGNLKKFLDRILPPQLR